MSLSTALMPAPDPAWFQTGSCRRTTDTVAIVFKREALFGGALRVDIQNSAATSRTFSAAFCRARDQARHQVYAVVRFLLRHPRNG